MDIWGCMGINEDVTGHLNTGLRHWVWGFQALHIQGSMGV